MSKQDRYFKRSWALLTRDKGWIKPLLVLCAAQVVPVVGAFGADGYALEWARLTAWEIDAAPKQKGVRVGECIASGARAFVVGLGFAVVGLIVSMLLAIPLGVVAIIPLIGALITPAVQAFVQAFFEAVTMIAQLRGAIYQSIGAGYKLSHIWEMLRQDFVGILKIMGIGIIIALAGGVVVGIVTGLAIAPFIIQLSMAAYQSNAMSSAAISRLLLSMIGEQGLSLALGLTVAVFVAVLIATFRQLILQTAIALWMRQFHVPMWGGSDDPLPVLGGLPGEGAQGPTSAGPSSYVPPVTSAQGFQGADMQNGGMTQGYDAPTDTSQGYGTPPTQQQTGWAQAPSAEAWHASPTPGAPMGQPENPYSGTSSAFQEASVPTSPAAPMPQAQDAPGASPTTAPSVTPATYPMPQGHMAPPSQQFVNNVGEPDGAGAVGAFSPVPAAIPAPAGPVPVSGQEASAATFNDAEGVGASLGQDSDLMSAGAGESADTSTWNTTSPAAEFEQRYTYPYGSTALEGASPATFGASPVEAPADDGAGTADMGSAEATVPSEQPYQSEDADVPGN